MWTYILRRVLLMIPTLFGVTVVSFCIMKIAPGDPKLVGANAAGAAGTTGQTAEAYRLQKRDLKLDRPLLLNFRYFQDQADEIAIVAHYLAGTDKEFSLELPSLVDPADEATEDRKDFLESLGIPDFEQQLADPRTYKALTTSIRAYVEVWAADLGVHGVPAALGILQDHGAELRLKIGAFQALKAMVEEPFTYTYSNEPSEEETEKVVTTWKAWWDRNQQDFPPLDPETQAALAEQLAIMAAKIQTSREEVFELLGNFERDYARFFAEKLLGESTLHEKVVCALFLRLYLPPLEVEVEADATAEEVQQVAENWLLHYRLHEKAYEFSTGQKWWNLFVDTQYANMIVRLVTFDFGKTATKSRESVGKKIWAAVKVSVPLMLMSQLFIYLVAIPLGILCGVYRGKWVDRTISVGLFLLYSIPAFVAGMLFLVFFCYGDYWKWFPMERLHDDHADSFTTGKYLLDYLWHAFLPVLCLSLFSLAGLAMYARSSMLDVINQDYMRTARAKGLPPRTVILKHGLRNALIPIITLFANFLPALLGGSVLIEYLFNIPGLGRLSWIAIQDKDLPTLMALTWIDALVVLVSIFISDVLYVLVDPRISFEGRGKA